MRKPVGVRHSRSGLTLTEVLVTAVLFFFTFVIAVALVDNGRSRASPKLECLNYLKNLGLAAASFSAANNGGYPYLTTAAERDADDVIATDNLAWTAALLPYLDNQAMAKQNLPSNGALKLKIFTCISDRSNFGQSGGISYVANAGYGAFTFDPASERVTEKTLQWQGQTYGHTPDAWFIDWDGDGKVGTPDDPDPEDQAIQRASGVFWRPAQDGFRMTLDAVLNGDGLNSTILFTENTNAGAAGNWYRPDVMNMAFVFGGDPGPRIGRRLRNGLAPLAAGESAAECDFFLGEVIEGRQLAIYGLNRSSGGHRGYLPAPSSNHSGSLNVAFAGGNSKSISEKIDPTVWARLMTPDGGRFGERKIGEDDY